MFCFHQWLDQARPLLQPSSLFFSVLIIFFLATFLTKSLFSAKPSKGNPPPSPPKLPIVGHLHQVGSHPHRSLLSLAQRYGPVILLHIGVRPAVVVSSADAAREIMKTHDLVFLNRPEAKVNRKLLYYLRDVAAAPYGEYWRQLKSILVLQLVSNKRVQSFREVREEETLIMMNKIKDSCSRSMPVNLSEMFLSIANDVSCRAAFGRKYSEGKTGKKFKQLLREFLELLGSADVEDFLPWLSWINRFNGRDSKVERVARGIDDFLEDVVKERIESIDCLEAENDFVDTLFRIHNQNDAVGSIDRDTIKALILDIFSAGTETTSTVMEWAMTELLRHPRAMEELQKEVRGIKSKQDITEDDLKDMHYLKAVIKETLRLHPPIPLLVPREASQDVKVMGYDIGAKTMVIINAWAIGRDPTSWDDPEKFRPERFLNSAIDFKGQDFELVPFGAGRRGCPGIAFAMATNELVLANVVHKFDWRLPDLDLDMRECTGLTIRREVPLVALATSCYS